jgi:hypothetical protein
MTNTFGLGEFSDTWPPIIWKGATSANGLIPALGKLDLPSLTVSRSTNGPLLEGDMLFIVVAAADCDVLSMILLIALLILTVF